MKYVYNKKKFQLSTYGKTLLFLFFNNPLFFFLSFFKREANIYSCIICTIWSVLK